MNDQVSFGSHPQYRPHAASAQMAPQITANVQIGKANAWIRKVIRSSASAAGIRAPRGYGNRVFPASYPLRTSVIAAAANPTMNVPDAMIAAMTRILSQYELDASTSDTIFV